MSNFAVVEPTDELRQEQPCSQCKEPRVNANLDSCWICDFKDACHDCLRAHRLKHSEEEVESLRLEVEAFTPREEFHEELKQQIRAQAETLCSLIDNTEKLLKSKEKQIAELAQELDRRMTVN